MVYVWSKRHPHTQLQFIGLMPFKAPWLPWVLLFLSILLNHDIKSDLLGIFVGHIYYFLKWIYPDITKPNKIEIVKTPQFIQYLFLQNDNNAYDVININ